MSRKPYPTPIMKNMLDEITWVMNTHGMPVVDIKWMGIPGKEWWPEYLLWDLLDFWWDPRFGVDPMWKNIVIVGENWMMDFDLLEQRWHLHLLPEMPDGINYNPHIWRGEPR